MASRELNGQIRRGRHDSPFVHFRCECTLKMCEASVSHSVGEYEEVLRVPTRFVVADGHSLGSDEVVVCRPSATWSSRKSAWPLRWRPS